MRPYKKWLKGLLLATVLVPVMIFTARTLPAAFTVPKPVVSVEINGTNYGEFDKINGLGQFDNDGLPTIKTGLYAKIRLSRDFVTSPSLYLWAKNKRSKKNELQDIHLISKDKKGNVLSRQVLEYCQPLSWTVEATNPSLGGFNETIELAVQKISTK